MSQESTHFGYRTVSRGEKNRLVRGVFDSVAGRYDLMNDLMSGGLHRLWKREFVATSGIRPGATVLDLAGGTGDIARLVARRVGAAGKVYLADINGHMVEVGRRRLDNRGLAGRVEYLIADAEHLPFPDNRFDAVTIAFGLRNVTDPPRALGEMQRVLRPGGRVLILEFSRVHDGLFSRLYDLHSFRILPWLGARVAGDAASYRYLAESIRRHPAQPELAAMLGTAGFVETGWRNLSAGIVAIHRGCKP